MSLKIYQNILKFRNKKRDFLHLLACANASVCLGLRSPTRPLMLAASNTPLHWVLALALVHLIFIMLPGHQRRARWCKDKARVAKGTNERYSVILKRCMTTNPWYCSAIIHYNSWLHPWYIPYRRLTYFFHILFISIYTVHIVSI